MSDTTSAGQDAPVVIDQATPPEAAPENAATAPAQTDGDEGGEKSPVVPPKTFTQAELDEVVQREKAKAEAKAERRVLRTLEKVMPAQQAAPQQQRQADGPPPRDAFANDEAWLDARDAWRDQKREQATTQQRAQEQAQKLAQTTEQIYAKAQAVPGFDRESFDELPLTKPIVEALIESDQAPQLMAYMAAHPEDVARIAGMSPARQAAELGKLEAKLAATPPVKTSKAPDPITPIGSGKTPVHDLASADMDTYLAMRKKQGARWAR